MNSIVHFDLMAKDPAKSKEWFSGLFGWQFEEVPEMNYWIIRTVETDPKTQMPTKPGAINGGMNKRDGNGVDRPVLTIDVDDIDATLEKIVASGGTIVQPKQQQGKWGATARFTDPDGTVFGRFQNSKW